MDSLIVLSERSEHGWIRSGEPRSGATTPLNGRRSVSVFPGRFGYDVRRSDPVVSCEGAVRFDALQFYLDQEGYSDVVREAQELVELLLKAVLRAAGRRGSQGQ